MTEPAGSGSTADLRALWTAYVVLGGYLALDELDEAVALGLELPSGERALLVRAHHAVRGSHVDG